ncbi:hypothetical protein RJ55_02887 [Drechmeria coniospora]|nr:hypothetical protein RJ55_02887 [Drechmeria coniospora]
MLPSVTQNGRCPGVPSCMPEAEPVPRQLYSSAWFCRNGRGCARRALTVLASSSLALDTHWGSEEESFPWPKSRMVRWSGRALWLLFRANVPQSADGGRLLALSTIVVVDPTPSTPFPCPALAVRPPITYKPPHCSSFTSSRRHKDPSSSLAAFGVATKPHLACDVPSVRLVSCRVHPEESNRSFLERGHADPASSASRLCSCLGRPAADRQHHEADDAAAGSRHPPRSHHVVRNPIRLPSCTVRALDERSNAPRLEPSRRVSFGAASLSRDRTMAFVSKQPSDWSVRRAAWELFLRSWLRPALRRPRRIDIHREPSVAEHTNLGPQQQGQRSHWDIAMVTTSFPDALERAEQESSAVERENLAGLPDRFEASDPPTGRARLAQAGSNDAWRSITP